MAIGKNKKKQERLFIDPSSLPRSAGHAFYDVVQKILCKHGFDIFVENLCAAYYADGQGRPSIPPGQYFRMHLVGYFEGIESERGIAWRCADSLSLRAFLQLDLDDAVPSHSSLSRIRSRLPLEVHSEVFQWIIKVLSKNNLIQGERLGIDSSTMEANAAMRSIVRKDTRQSYDEMLENMCKESGIATPSREEMVRMDKKRQGKKLSNEDWESTTDSDAKIARMKDKTTKMAYKPEHVVDLDTGAIVGVKIQPANKGDTQTIESTLQNATQNLKEVYRAPNENRKVELVADKGYFSRDVIKNAENAHFSTRIAEPHHDYWYSWHGDHEARKAVYANRARLKSEKGKASMRKRGEMVERSFQHVLDKGGQRRCHLRGQENVEKAYLLATAAFNLGLVLRKITKYGTPKGLGQGNLHILAVIFDNIVCIVCYEEIYYAENTTFKRNVLLMTMMTF